ncbi:hypothetical protein [Chitinophaga qingshengii]|uniref:TPM domain-containing protein n=1 Tax=Chitinophaga qingshengii TaxID=1569794 RepID=A0ABR7TIX8_9BACT|nr:hypothetical protein [Chitinophaga qingshengii]MBC9930409.1 hypothetical protein [Chitinophaga qingshengii]
MMKRKATLVIILVGLGLLVLCFKYIYGWMSFHRNVDTSVGFLNNTVVSGENYIQDSTQIIHQLKKSLLRHEDFFNSSAYDDSTQIIIDSIVYSPDLKKVGILVIAKNATSKQLLPDKRYNWYYDATCYLGVRQADSITLKMTGATYTNSYSEQRISDIMRAACFRTFAIDDSLHKYNLNDTRFWSAPIWKKYFDQ